MATVLRPAPVPRGGALRAAGGVLTLAFAIPFTFAGSQFTWLTRGLVTATGLVSLIFGLFAAYQIGFVDGLFTANPSWVPR